MKILWRHECFEDWITTTGMVSIVWAFDNAELFKKSLMGLEDFEVSIDLRNTQILHCKAKAFAEFDADDMQTFMKTANDAIETKYCQICILHT